MSGCHQLPGAYFLLFFLLSVVWVNGQKYGVAQEDKDKLVQHPPCKACRVLTDSFKHGLDTTKMKNHGGGDTDWETRNLRTYEDSEVRLVEIQEKLCTEVTRGQGQCYTMANEHETLLDEWFFERKKEQPDVFDWLCIDQLKVCCPKGHHGAQCKKCPSCNGNGKCKGDGTRKGNGACSCDTGYTGEACEKCTTGTHYQSFKDDTKLLCTPCNKACEGGCSGPGPKACRDCQNGWYMHAEHGCFDINECLDNPKICKPSQFCINKAGSYSCLECDRSCDGCDGDGPDMCKKCAKGFELKEGKCEDVSEEKRDSYVNFTRFLTYFGLCVATCVIFQSSSYIAFIVGAAVAIYIAASEYWLNTTPQGGAKPQFDTKQLEEMIMKNL